MSSETTTSPTPELAEPPPLAYPTPAAPAPPPGTWLLTVTLADAARLLFAYPVADAVGLPALRGEPESALLWPVVGLLVAGAVLALLRSFVAVATAVAHALRDVRRPPDRVGAIAVGGCGTLVVIAAVWLQSVVLHHLLPLGRETPLPHGPESGGYLVAAQAIVFVLLLAGGGLMAIAAFAVFARATSPAGERSA